MKIEAPEAETIYYTYVLDENKRLVGVLSLRSLVIAEPDDLVKDIMSDNAISVSAGRDQEDVAQMIRDYDFLALPVVDFQNHLLGRSEEHTSELQSRGHLVCRLLLEK